MKQIDTAASLDKFKGSLRATSLQTLVALTPNERKQALGRLWEMTDRPSADECWEWQGAKNNSGYGRIRIAGRLFLAHRASHELINGPLPTPIGKRHRSLIVCHRCDNPGCVNPRHLFAGTHIDNARDGLRKGRPIGRPKKS